MRDSWTGGTRTRISTRRWCGARRRSAARGGIAGGLAAGKGIVPFGTDDPMSRPFVRFPVNHHLAQIVERAEIATGWRLGIGRARGRRLQRRRAGEPGPVAEHEPLRRFLGRAGDLWPVRGLEVQGSHRLGSFAGAPPGSRARPGEVERVGAACSDWWDARRSMACWNGPAPRRATTRSCSPRCWRKDRSSPAGTESGTGSSAPGDRKRSGYFDNLFRSPRPLLDNSIVGQTRWTLHTINYALQLSLAQGRFGVQPFVEVTFGQVSDVGGGALPG